MSNRSKKRRMTCEHCGNPFVSSRIDASYCSSTCRTQARRAKQGKDKAIAQAIAAIDNLTNFCINPSAAETIKEVISWMCKPEHTGGLKIVFEELNNDVSVG